MSADWVYVKFKDTGNIYYGVYEGSSDLVNPYLCTPKECYETETDAYNPIRFCRNKFSELRDICYHIPICDWSEVDICTDYGGGFYWKGVGSESEKILDSFSCKPWDNLSSEFITDGIPGWVINHCKEMGFWLPED